MADIGSGIIGSLSVRYMADCAVALLEIGSERRARFNRKLCLRPVARVPIHTGAPPAGVRMPALRHLCATHSEVFDTVMFGEDWRTSGEAAEDIVVCYAQTCPPPRLRVRSACQ